MGSVMMTRLRRDRAQAVRMRATRGDGRWRWKRRWLTDGERHDDVRREGDGGGRKRGRDDVEGRHAPGRAGRVEEDEGDGGWWWRRWW
jgi:hypothetical protein